MESTITNINKSILALDTTLGAHIVKLNSLRHTAIKDTKEENTKLDDATNLLRQAKEERDAVLIQSNKLEITITHHNNIIRGLLKRSEELKIDETKVRDLNNDIDRMGKNKEILHSEIELLKTDKSIEDIKDS